jgi:hypothetical protein
MPRKSGGAARRVGGIDAKNDAPEAAGARRRVLVCFHNLPPGAARGFDSHSLPLAMTRRLTQIKPMRRIAFGMFH